MSYKHLSLEERYYLETAKKTAHGVKSAFD
jgi:hypothetical protein